MKCQLMISISNMVQPLNLSWVKHPLAVCFLFGEPFQLSHVKLFDFLYGAHNIVPKPPLNMANYAPKGLKSYRAIVS